MNYQVRKILSTEERLAIRHVLTYDSILQARDDRRLIYLVKSNLRQQLADAFIERNFPQISEVDAPEGRIYQTSVFIYTYPELTNLLEKAYNQGQLDRLASQPLSLTNFNDPSNTKT